MAELGHFLGLSEEIGAFIAGVALASNPISFYIAESLKPLRDFFLVMYFFTIGAGFNLTYFPQVIFPALTIALLILVIKPMVFRWLLFRAGETKSVSREIGVRLGQMSEFSLLIVYMACDAELFTSSAAYMIEAAIIITFIVSCYWTIMEYPTPMAWADKLRKD
jgi:Kef-type K+ transport system membrane component KefB